MWVRLSSLTASGRKTHNITAVRLESLTHTPIAMTDERPTDQPEAADSTTTVQPPVAADGDHGTVAAATNGRAADPACRDTDDSQDGLQTKILSTEEARHFAAFRFRQLFSQAQEQFTAGEFVEANRYLKEIPEDARNPDIDRLALLVVARIREVAELRSGIQTALNQGKKRKLLPRLMRLLELQPGDEWANTIRHRIEDEDAAAVSVGDSPRKSPTERPIVKTIADVPQRVAAVRPILKTVADVPKEVAAVRPILKTVADVPKTVSAARPITKTVADAPREIGSPRAFTRTLVELPAGFVEPLKTADEPDAPQRPVPAPVERRPPPAASRGTAAIEIVDDDAEVDEVWEFGERLVKSGPPPLKPHMTRPQSVRVRPASRDDEIVGWLEPEPPHSTTGMWIAIAVSGVVVLLALIATIVVLLVEKGS